ncbi:MAG: GNAT family N-acetyltransferase [Gemmatimonadaceae bacterium]
MKIAPVVLEGSAVRLEPLSDKHFEDLCTAGIDPDLWRWTLSQIESPEDMRRYMDEALQAQTEGSALPFAIITRADARAVGSTRFGNIDGANRRLEIGWTWIARTWQRTTINTEAKYLLLCHAFESLGCIRVEFKTDALNHRSRAALLRIGAKEEGTFRKHMITSTGRVRDSVYFSITDDDWPAVKVWLERQVTGNR